MPRKNRKLDKPSKRRAWDKEVQLAKQKERELYRELPKMNGPWVPFVPPCDEPDELDDPSQADDEDRDKDQETGT